MVLAPWPPVAIGLTLTLMHIMSIPIANNTLQLFRLPL
jgi:hypothetical protein